MRAGIFMLFPLVGWEKGLFYQKEAGILYLSPLDTLHSHGRPFVFLVTIGACRSNMSFTMQLKILNAVLTSGDGKTDNQLIFMKSSFIFSGVSPPC